VRSEGIRNKIQHTVRSLLAVVRAAIRVVAGEMSDYDAGGACSYRPADDGGATGGIAARLGWARRAMSVKDGFKTVRVMIHPFDCCDWVFSRVGAIRHHQ